MSGGLEHLFLVIKTKEYDAYGFAGSVEGLYWVARLFVKDLAIDVRLDIVGVIDSRERAVLVTMEDVSHIAVSWSMGVKLWFLSHSGLDVGLD